MLFKTLSASVHGIDAYLVEVEMDVGSADMNQFNVVGLPDNAVKESRRIDIQIEVPSVRYKELRATVVAEDSAAARERVMEPASATQKIHGGKEHLFERADGAKKGFANTA
jgi:predicted ATPase with chaperone activity